MTNKEPKHKIRFGLVEAAIWENEGDKNAFFNVTLERLYKPKDSKNWKSTKSFGRDDLLALAEVARDAFRWIHEQ